MSFIHYLDIFAMGKRCSRNQLPLCFKLKASWRVLRILSYLVSFGEVYGNLMSSCVFWCLWVFSFKIDLPFWHYVYSQCLITMSLWRSLLPRFCMGLGTFIDALKKEQPNLGHLWGNGKPPVSALQVHVMMDYRRWRWTYRARHGLN